MLIVDALEPVGTFGPTSAVPAVPARTLLWTRAGARPLPAGLGPAGPTRIVSLLRSRVVSPAGLARASVEPVVRRMRIGEDASVGDYVAHRFGRQVVDRVVDPLLGGLHAGDVSRLSLRAVTPQLADVADRHRSVVLAHLRRGTTAPALVTFRGGLQVLVDRLLAELDVRTSTPVTRVTAASGRYRLHLADGGDDVVDSIVVTLPAPAAAAVMTDLTPDAAGPLAGLRAASVATVVLAYPAAAAGSPLMSATGLMVPSTAGLLLKSATFLSRKWPHLRREDRVLVRLSAGRAGADLLDGLDDGDLVETPPPRAHRHHRTRRRPARLDRPAMAPHHGPA